MPLIAEAIFHVVATNKGGSAPTNSASGAPAFRGQGALRCSFPKERATLE